MKIYQQEFLYHCQYLCGSTYIIILFFRIMYAKVLQEMEHVSHSKSKSLNMKFYDVASINNISLSLTHLFIENLTSYRAECDNMGGTKDGTCADGFGICCIGIIWIENNNIIGFIDICLLDIIHDIDFSIVTLSSGQSSSVNNSYIVHKSTSTLAAGIHHYTICPSSDDICRVKFDFTVRIME